MSGLTLTRDLTYHQKGWSCYVLSRTDGGPLKLPMNEQLERIFKGQILGTPAVRTSIRFEGRTENECRIVMTAGTQEWVRSDFRKALERL